MALHILKVGDELQLGDGRFRVFKINSARAALVSAETRHVSIRNKFGKKYEFDASNKKVIGISPDYEGPVFRDGYKIDVISRKRFIRIKEGKEPRP